MSGEANNACMSADEQRRRQEAGAIMASVTAHAVGKLVQQYLLER